MFNTSTSDRCGNALLSLHVQNVPRQWPWCTDMVFQTLQTGSWEGTSSTDRVVKAKSQSQRHFRTFVVSKGSIFLACFEFENPKAWFMWSGSWQGLWYILQMHQEPGICCAPSVGSKVITPSRILLWKVGGHLFPPVWLHLHFTWGFSCLITHGFLSFCRYWASTVKVN